MFVGVSGSRIDWVGLLVKMPSHNFPIPGVIFVCTTAIYHG